MTLKSRKLQGIGPDGNLSPIEGNVIFKSALWIILANLFEAFGFFSMTSGQVTFYTSSQWMHTGMVRAMEYQSIMSAIAFITPVIGSIIADGYLGRYRMILVSAIVASLSAIGTVLAINCQNKALFLVCFMGLYSWSVGQLKPNLIVLGADQFNEQKPEQLKQRGYYFGTYYWFANIAAAVAMFLINYISFEGLGSVKIGSDFSYLFPFIIGAGATTMVLITMAAFGNNFFRPKPEGSLVVEFGKITKAALTNKPEKNHGRILVGSLIFLILTVVIEVPSFFMDPSSNGTLAFQCTLGVLILVLSGLVVIFGRDSSWVHHARASAGKFSDRTIAGTAEVYRITPFLALAVPFWSVYNSMSTLFVAQGCQMEDNGYPPQCILGFEGVAILIVIPFLNKVVYPFFQKFKGGKYTLTPLRKLVIGLFITSLAMISSAAIEYKRRSAPIAYEKCTNEVIERFRHRVGGTGDAMGSLACRQDTLGKDVMKLSSCGTNTVNSDGTASIRIYPEKKMSLYWMIVPYSLVGFAEVLFSVTCLEFFYAQVPSFVRSLCNSLYSISTAFGLMVGSLVTAICQNWITGNLNETHLEYAYFVLFGLCIASMTVTAIVSQGFEYKPGTSGYVHDNRVALALSSCGDDRSSDCSSSVGSADGAGCSNKEEDRLEQLI